MKNGGDLHEGDNGNRHRGNAGNRRDHDARDAHGAQRARRLVVDIAEEHRPPRKVERGAGKQQGMPPANLRHERNAVHYRTSLSGATITSSALARIPRE